MSQSMSGFKAGGKINIQQGGSGVQYIGAVESDGDIVIKQTSFSDEVYPRYDSDYYIRSMNEKIKKEKEEREMREMKERFEKLMKEREEENQKRIPLLEGKDIEATKEEEECSVCKENKKTTVTSCGHIYACIACANNQITNKTGCYVCRKDITSFARVYI